MADITGTSGSETLTGTEDADTINGLGGNDTLIGAGGNDTLNGGEGVDTLEGGAGDDTLNGGNSTDTARYFTATSGVTVSLAIQGVAQNTGGAGNDTLIGIERLTGSNYDDVLTGDGASNYIQGHAGNDILDGGDGMDFAHYGSASMSVHVDLALQGTIQNTVGAGWDTLTNFENISGSQHSDWLAGDDQSNWILGQAGDDEIFGRGGDDFLYGLGGTDTIDGGSGVDTIVYLGNRSDYTITAGDGFYTIVDSRTGPTADGTDFVTSIEFLQFADQTIALAPLEPAEVGEAVDDSLVVTSGIASSLDLGALLTNDTLWDGWSLTSLSNVTGGSAAIVDGRLVVTATGPMSFDYTITGPSGSKTAHVTVSTVSTGKAVDSITAVYELQGADLVGQGGSDVLVGSGGWDRLVGGDGNDSLNGVDGSDLMVGGAGNDTYYVSEAGDSIVEDADGGFDTVYLQDNYEMAANLEKAILLSSATSVVGNALDNTIIGNALANEIDGGEGADRMEGGAGDDIYYVDNIGDRVIDTAGDDTVVTLLTTYTLGAGIENLRGGNLYWDFNLNGNSANNKLYGGNGADRLDGKAGADQMNGGDGNDTYVIDNVGDTVIDSGGYDTVETRIAFTLANGSAIERVVAIGSGAIALTGNGAANLLEGAAGANTLDGAGGADTMIGHAGNDTYIVDNVGDVVTEDADEGLDTVRSSISLTLSANLENLVLIGSALNGTGNALANTLTGNELNNLLDGGAGADIMKGGLGDDTYVVDDAGDKVTETGAGIDTVRASVSYTLGGLVENLVLLGAIGLVGTGNGLANTITGGDGDDTLSGLAGDDVLDGGAGADAMDGGTGNDIYVVDDAGDTIADSAGVDTVRTSLSVYTLAAGVENLTYTGDGAFAGTGNALANVFTGGAGVDTFTGLGGNDTYNVGAGDIVVEAADGGIDTVLTALASYTLGANVEILRFTGSGPFTGVGNDGSNVFFGGVNADTFAGGAGNDTYYVDAWDTVIEAADGGVDTVMVSFANTPFGLSGNIENVTFVGDYSDTAGGFVAYGTTGDNVMRGGERGDSFSADGGNDTLFGEGGDDSLWGAAGDDTLYGGEGRDHLTGDYGKDIIIGGAGADAMMGNSGIYPVTPEKDVFRYLALSDSGVGDGLRDIIADFDLLDVIDLKTIDANTGLAGNQAFTFIGNGAFTGVAGQLRYFQDSEGVHIYADVNGDGVADFEILLWGSVTPNVSNFLL